MLIIIKLIRANIIIRISSKKIIKTLKINMHLKKTNILVLLFNKIRHCKMTKSLRL